jgi:hypothetical protein
MRSAVILISISLLGLACSTALAQDPIKADPVHWKAEIETNQFRVLRFNLEPGGRSMTYALGPSVALYVTEYHVKATSFDGKTTERGGDAGSLAWTPPERGKVENPTRERVEAIFVVLTNRRAFTPQLLSTAWPKDFQDSVRFDQEALAILARRVESSESISDRDTLRAHDATQDLELKTSWMRQQSSGSPVVDVKVNTLDQKGNGVPSCEVWYVPYAWKDDPSRRERFDKLSTPTAKALPVGRYEMWTRKLKREGERRPVSPGDDGKKTKEVDLPAPN